MCYREELHSLNTLIEIVIELDNNFYRFVIKTYYSKTNSKKEYDFEYISYCNK